MDKTAQQLLDDKRIQVIPAPRQVNDKCPNCHKIGNKEIGIMVLLNRKQRQNLAKDLGFKKIPYAIQCSICQDIWKVDGPLKVRKRS